MTVGSVKRLHLGASSLELLSQTPTSEFIDSSWVHLGDEPNYDARSDTGTFKSKARAVAKRILRKRHVVRSDGASDLYQKTDFRPWIFNSGDTLPFTDDSVSFIYSEHVFEHFRFDIAVELFAESYRVLQPGAVIRTVVPDADYRTYEAPEPAGYPGRALLFNHPNKHKVRWNAYMLGKTLEFVGFRSVNVVWCDEDGNYINNNPEDLYGPENVDFAMVSTLRYVQRPISLIVDGVKI
ncbi:methyltransferase domain-containing protein [Xanthobacter sp.]|uniref:class I SAM-dependent methyltransferase n=1 Tax=Xanthobacter sp. TaxID=35809 RepID=UPI0025D1EA4C|nr:methyltransferase domain-containing protein [Xanthobacter sp.]